MGVVVVFISEELQNERSEDLNADKLKECIEKHHSTVFRVAYSFVKKREDAEDIVQEAFFRLYTAEKEFLSDENIKAWLIRVSVNLAKDMLKSSHVRNRTELTEEIPCGMSREDTLSEMIRRLKGEYCTVLLLFYYEGYTVREIAEIMKTSQTLVTTRLSRARKQLKKILLEEGYDEEIY